MPRSYSNMGHLGLKKVPKPKYRNTMLTLEAIILIQISFKLVRKVVLVISMSHSNIGLLWSKAKSHSPKKFIDFMGRRTKRQIVRMLVTSSQ
jgi:hypothetical protein